MTKKPDDDEEEISLQEIVLLLDGWNNVMEKMLTHISETLSGLRTYLYIHIIRPLKIALTHYKKEVATEMDYHVAYGMSKDEYEKKYKIREGDESGH